MPACAIADLLAVEGRNGSGSRTRPFSNIQRRAKK
jgi:hypothetical protein